MQTGADVSNTGNVILGSLYLPFVLFDTTRPEMSKQQGFYFLVFM